MDYHNLILLLFGIFLHNSKVADAVIHSVPSDSSEYINSDAGAEKLKGNDVEISVTQLPITTTPDYVPPPADQPMPPTTDQKFVPIPSQKPVTPATVTMAPTKGATTDKTNSRGPEDPCPSFSDFTSASKKLWNGLSAAPDTSARFKLIGNAATKTWSTVSECVSNTFSDLYNKFSSKSSNKSTVQTKQKWKKDIKPRLLV